METIEDKADDNHIMVDVENQNIDLTDKESDDIPLRKLDIKKANLLSQKQQLETSETDSPSFKHLYASKKNVAEGMMDIALLTANANQLRFLITFNSESKTFYVNVVLIILSLVLQVAVGIALIFKRQMKNRGKRSKISRANDFLVGGVFIITVINVFVAAFTTTENARIS